MSDLQSPPIPFTAPAHSRGKASARILPLAAAAVALIGAAVLVGWGQPRRAAAVASPRFAAADLLAQVHTAFVDQGARATRFVARLGGVSAHLAADAMTFQVVREIGSTSAAERRTRGVNLRFVFEGASPALQLHGRRPLPGVFHDFRGADAAAWRTDLATYERVVYENLWSGVDLEVREQDRNCEYDLVLGAGVDVDRIVMRVEGARGPMRIDDAGALIIDTEVGEVRQPRPTTWQEQPGGGRLPVACSYRLLRGERFGFVVPERNQSLALVIDPALVWSTYLGGSGRDEGLAVAVDASGAVYLTGRSESTNFPITPGAFDATANGDVDVFVTKLAASGSSLVWSTLMGGTGTDIGTAIAVDATGAATVGGWTSSTAFPTTVGAYDTTYNGANDGFVARFSTSGGLVYSTFLGGSSADSVQAVVVDAAGTATAAGSTASGNYPSTAGAFQPAYAGVGSTNAFVTRLSLVGDALTWSTFLGPVAEARGAALDSSGEVTVTGWTGNAAYPTTAGAYDTSYNGNRDAFVTRLAASGGSLVWSTFVGGTQTDEAYAVATDSTGATVLAGITFSANFPTTAGAADTTFGGGTVDGFATKLTPAGGGLAWSTFLGGAVEDRAFGLALDPTGVATVVGRTNSADFPTTADAFDTTFNSTVAGSGYDAFVTQLGASSGSLVHSTFVGGTNSDEGLAAAMSATGVCTLVGFSFSPNFPTTPGAFIPGNTLFNSQAIVVKMQLAVVDTTPPQVTITAPADGAILGTTAVLLAASLVDASPTAVVSTPSGINAALPAGGGAVSGTVALAVEGTNTLTVSATDAANNVGGTSISLIRDTTAPTVQIVSPADGAILTDSPASLTVQVGDATATMVVFGGNSVSLPAGGGQAAGDVALVEGPNALAVTATDAAGHPTTSIVNVVLDLTAPVVTIDTPADGASFGPGEAQIAVVATVDDLTATSVTSTPPGVSGALPAGGGFVTGTALLVEGVNTLTVVANDGASRTGSAMIALLLDTTAPSVSLDAPASGGILRGSIDFEASAADIAPGTGIARIDLLVDNVLAASPLAPPFHVTFDTTGLADGMHAFAAVAVDGKGNSASASVNARVDNTAPAISIAAPVANAIVAGTVPFTVTAGDGGSGLASVTMLAGGNPPTVDGSILYPGPVAADTRHGQIDTTTMLDGALVLAASTVDAAGNESGATVTVVVDNTAPQKTITSPTDGSVVGGIVPIVATANDPNLAYIEILVDNASVGTSATSPFAVGFDTRARMDGPMSITVLATDLANNTSTCSITVTVDNQSMVSFIPRLLNLKTKASGNATVTAHLEGANVALLLPPQAHGVELRVPGGSAVPVSPGSVSIDDSDSDGIPEVTFRFDRQAVVASIRAGIAANVIASQPRQTEVLLTLVADGSAIASDQVSVQHY